MSVYITVLWSPGVEPGEQAQELAVVVAVLELVAAVVVLCTAGCCEIGPFFYMFSTSS